MSAKMRFSPYLPSVRKPPTDGQNRKRKWEEKRGASPPADEYLQDQERRKSCQKASTNQKTSRVRYFQSSSSDSGAEDTDQGAQKKPILPSDRKVTSRSPSKSPSKDRSSDTRQTRKTILRKNKSTSRKALHSRTRSPSRHRFASKRRSTSREKTLRKLSLSPSPARSTSTEGNHGSSTVSSSSDKSDEKTSSVRSLKHILKPPKFDGS